MVVSSLNGCYINSTGAVATLNESGLTNSNMRWTSALQTSSPVGTEQTNCQLNFTNKSHQLQSPIQTMEENSSYGSDNGMDNNSGDSLSPHQENNNNSIGNNNNNSSFEDNNSSSIGAVSQLFPVSGVGSGIGSRSIAEYSSENESCSQASPSSYNEDDSSMFRGGSNGASTTTMTKNGPNGTKVKVHKCRNCGFTTTNKHESWLHIAIHMKPEKILRCPDCPFVTEYKHHLDFHVWNHQGMKPYKCDQCPYVCVNKSMLKSHLKSHSNVYQYRCANCAYRTKYCHSLKIHLRKYRHEPGVVLDSDGRPNPNPVIDVYGNRRGPKQRSKKHGSVSPSGSSSTTASSSFILSQVVPSAAAAAAAAAAVPSPTAPGVGQLNSPYHQSFPWMQSIFFRSDDNSAPGTTSLTPPIPAAALISQILPATNACNLDNSKLDDFCLKQLDANNKHNNNNNNFNYRNINNNDNNQLNLHSCLAESVKELPVPRYPSPKQSNPTVEVPMIYDRLTPNNDFAEGANAIESVSPLLDCVPLNLSLTTGSGPLMTTSDPSASSGTSLVTGDSGSSTKMKNRRKGIACKLKRNYLTAARSSDDEEVSDSLFRQSSSKSPEELSRISDSVEQQQQQQQQQQKQQQEQQHLDYYHRAVGTARRLSTAGRSDSAVTNRATTDDSEEESSTSPVLSNFDKSMIDNSGAAKSYLKQQSSASLKSEEENKSCFYCKHCEITFFNQVMFTMHMGYHGFADPFTCNRCGKKTDNNIGFYAHMITAPHS